MKTVDPQFPVFVLSGLLVGETYYAKTLVPRTKELKGLHIGNSSAILHSRDIRRCQGDFAFLRESTERKQRFYDAINELYARSRIRLFAVVINKQRLLARSLIAPNPYDVSLSQLLSLVCGPPRLPGPARPTIRAIIAESRGKNEDKDLQREYQSLRQLGLYNYGAEHVQNRRPGTVQRLFPERVEFVRKSRGVTGLELTDLAAYPIARASISNDWSNPAAQVLLRKLKSWVAFP